MFISKTSVALLLLVAAASNDITEAANLRQAQRNLGPTYSQSSDFLYEMLARVNKERAAEGLPPVCANKKLQSSSQRHTNDMAKRDYMAHAGMDGSTTSQRITDAGYKWDTVGENVAAGQEDVQAVMDAWMHSPEHRENIMGDFTMLGASYAFNEDSTHKHYWTQDFGKGGAEACDSGLTTGSINRRQVNQNSFQVQSAADTKDTPVAKTAVHVTDATKTVSPHSEKETSDEPVTPAPTSPETELPEAELSPVKTEVPGKFSPANDCDL